MTGQPTPHSSKTHAILLIAPFAALALFLAVYISPSAPDSGPVFWQLFIYGLIAAMITGIWAGVSHERWSGWRFAGTFAVLLTLGIVLMGAGRLSTGTAKATDPASEKPADPWIVLSE
jgi:hypothetical protein